MPRRFLTPFAAFLMLTGAALAQGGPPPLPVSPPPLPTPAAPPPLPVPVQTPEWFVAVDGQQEGPVTLDALRARALTADTPVWREGMAGWTAAGEVPDLADSTVAPTPADTTAYFVDVNGTAQGPFDRAAMEQRIRAGELAGDRRVWHEGLSEWVALSDTPLASLLPAAPPAPPQPEPQPPTPEPAADPTLALLGRWQGTTRQTAPGLPAPIEMQISMEMSPNGVFSAQGDGSLDLRSQGVPQPIPMQAQFRGNWSAVPAGGDNYRLRLWGTMTASMPTLGVHNQTEPFDETDTVTLTTPDTLRYPDGSTLRRVGP